MLFSIKKLGNIIPAIKDTVLRFPLPLFSALGASIIAMLLLHEVNWSDREFIVRCLATLIFAVFSLASLKLFVESKRWSMIQHMLAAVIIIMVIILYVWGIIVESSPSTYIFLSLAILLSLLFAPYIKRPGNSASVWYFNYQSGVAVFFAGIAAVILGSGLSLILLSIGYLFEVDISDKAYGDVWIISWGVLFSVYILSSIGKEFDYEDKVCDFPKGVSFITNYILVPLMFVYMFILYAYFLKIIVQWELPRGNLGWMITTFGSIGIITKLLAYPIRNAGTRLLMIFDRYYYYALIVPVLLLVMAISVRITEYGITEPRYGVVLLGVWFLSVILLTFVKKDNFQIKHVPMILAALAMFASFGPLSAVSVSVNSQLSRFEALLAENKLLHNGQAIKSDKSLAFEDLKTLSSIADYLSKGEFRQERIKPLFKSLIAEQSNKTLDKNNEISGEKYIELLGLNYVRRWQTEKHVEKFEYSLKSYTGSVLVDSSGFDYVGHNNVYASSDNLDKRNLKLLHKNKLQSIGVEFDGKIFLVKTESGDTVEFNLVEHIENLRKKNINTVKAEDVARLTLTSKSRNKKLKARLLLENIYGRVTADREIKITNVDYVLMLKM